MHVRDVSFGFVENVDDSLDRLCTFGAVQVSRGCSKNLEAGGHVGEGEGEDERECYGSKTCESASLSVHWTDYLCYLRDMFDAVQKASDATT